MKEDQTHVNYLGRLVPKMHFRAFVYSHDKDVEPKIAESWVEFQKYMSSGVWFATKEEAKEHAPAESDKKEKPKKSNSKPKKDE